MAAETDAVETFKMHAPLMGNRADCEREGEGEKQFALCRGVVGGVHSYQRLRTQRGDLEGWNRSEAGIA